MQIHVVQPGQSLFSIAGLYGTTAAAIAEANQQPPEQPLAVGQALVVPIVGRFYNVRQGDSLWAIGRRFGVSPNRLAEVNRIDPNQPLQVGQRLYIPPGARRSAEANAYVEAFEEPVPERLIDATREAVPYLTYLGPFSFQLNRDGTVRWPPLNDFVGIALRNRVTPMMVVTNLEEGAFSAELGEVILNDMEVQSRALNNIIEIAQQIGFREIHFDMEFLRPEDREAYIAFLTRARERLAPLGFLMSVALAPKTRADQPGPWYEAHDYGAIGEVADFVVPMTYEWGYSGGPPMPVSPLDKVREVLEYALTEMPANKILMGQNLYGYDWTLPYEPGGEYARAISPQQAIRIAAERGVVIEYDEVAQAPHFNYVDDEGNEHEVWFEDARSIQAKFDLIKELGLRGISYWKLGLAFPQNWLLLEDNFEIAKLI